MMMEQHELPGYLVTIILILAILCLAIFLAFLGYLPSPLTTKLDAHDIAARRADRAGLVACGAMMELAKRPPLKCFEEDDPRNIFLGAR